VLPDLRTIGRLRRLIEAGQPDLVHAHGLRAGALAAIALAFARRRSGVQAALVVTVHNASPEGALTGAIYRVLELIVARNADSVLCVSPDLEQRMQAAGARRVRRAVVPPPVVSLTAPPIAALSPAAPSAPAAASQAGDVSAETRAAAGAVPRGPVILAVGRLATQKGFGTLIEAAARWRDLRPEPVLVIVGEGPLEAELKGQAAALGLTVEFAGLRTDVPSLLATAAVFVLPSAWEGQALVLQEALRAGVPIVATRVGGTPALIGEDTAVLIPPGDAERLASAVRAVLTDPALAARLRAAAAARAQGLPGEADAVAAALAEYELVTGGGGAVRA
jgi:glycosyltransferase involved in cell wall biosynthesis